MRCQVHHGLSGGIAAADHIDVFAAAKRRLAGSCTIIEPASKQFILVGQVETTPLHAGSADISAGDHRPAVGEVDPDTSWNVDFTPSCIITSSTPNFTACCRARSAKS